MQYHQFGAGAYPIGRTEKVKIYRFKTDDFIFSENYILAGQTLQVKFESGKLNGMTFDLAINPEGKRERITVKDGAIKHKGIDHPEGLGEAVFIDVGERDERTEQADKYHTEYKRLAYVFVAHHALHIEFEILSCLTKLVEGIEFGNSFHLHLFHIGRFLIGATILHTLVDFKQPRHDQQQGGIIQGMTKRETTAQGGIEVEELIESTKDDVGKNQGIQGNGQQPPFDTDVDERSGQHIPPAQSP